MEKTTISQFAKKTKGNYNYLWGVVDKNKNALVEEGAIMEEKVRVNNKIYIIDTKKFIDFIDKLNPKKRGIKNFISTMDVPLSYISVWNIINRNKKYLLDNSVISITKHLSKKKIEVVDCKALANFINRLSE